MSECCDGCQAGILDPQDAVRCAGPCGKSFHLSCAETDEYRKTRGVLKDATGSDYGKSFSSPQFDEELLKPWDQTLPDEVLLMKVIENLRKMQRKDVTSSDYGKSFSSPQSQGFLKARNTTFVDEALKGAIEDLCEIQSRKQKSDNSNKIKDLHELQSYKKELGISEIKKDLSELRIQEHDTSIKDITEELHELRNQNDALRTENMSLVSQMKVLEIKVNDGTKMFDECRKMVFNLSKNLDKNNKLVEELRGELNQVQTQNLTLQDENEQMLRAFNVLENKVNGFERIIKNFTERKVAPPGAVAVRRPEEVTVKPSVSDVQRQDRIVVMTGTTQKHQSFAVEAMGNKPVTSLPGIGPVYGGRLNDMGYYKASQVYEKFLSLNKNPALFQGWLNAVCGANSRWAGQCYQSLYNWDINFK